jgi:pyridoxine kinase
MEKAPHVLAISSFAVHGTASLKTFTTILGEKVLPVPSLLLNGLTNMSLIKKLDYPFAELLRGTFELAVNRELELILYIGYLGNTGQVDMIIEMIGTYRSIIKTIIVDPVCGDHGRAYVPAEVIARWPELINQADWVFPNITEIKLLTGNPPDVSDADEVYIDQFRTRFPNTGLVITSLKTADSEIGIRYYSEDHVYNYSHPVQPQNFGGTGDAFLALFILQYFYNKLSTEDALKQAADQTYQLIGNTIQQNSTDLLLSTINKP